MESEVTEDAQSDRIEAIARYRRGSCYLLAAGDRRRLYGWGDGIMVAALQRRVCGDPGLLARPRRGSGDMCGVLQGDGVGRFTASTGMTAY